MEEQSIPEKLIKYCRCDKNSCDALLNNYLWAAYPLQFNDPFDCSEKIWDINSFSYELILKNFPDFHDVFSKDQHNFQRRRLFIEMFSPGIICLNERSDKNEDILWGYYSNQEGFCIEFNSAVLTENFKNAEIIKVDYKDPNKINKIWLTNIDKNFREWISVKKKMWSAENEWRFIFWECTSLQHHPLYNLGDKRHRQKIYDIEAIISITLGYRFFAEQVHNQRKESLTDDTDRYSFLPQDNSCKLNILTYAYERGIDLYHIDLTEKFEFIKRKIEILEIKSNKVTIYYTGIIK